MDSINGKFEGAKKDAEEFADKGKSKYDEVKREVKNGVSDIKHTIIS
jgi:hypothetical protein